MDAKEFEVFASFANTVLAKGEYVGTSGIDNKFSQLQKQLSDFLKASKKISQLIAKSWLPEGEELKKVFLSGDENRVKHLLESEGIKLQDFSIDHVFVNWDSFYGTLTELSFVYYLPYPPRPSEVKDEQLKDWVSNENPEQIYPPYPYIPLTIC